MTISDTLITTYLEIRDWSLFTPHFSTNPRINIIEAKVPLAAFYRFLYAAVGAEWRWYDRYSWTDEELEAWLGRPETALHVLYVDGTPAGYIELDYQGESVEVAYFGLIANFFGGGLGKHLLSYGLQQIKDSGAGRAWVHTCNLDGPAALQTYQRCGFQVYDVQEEPMPPEYRQDLSG